MARTFGCVPVIDVTMANPGIRFARLLSVVSGPVTCWFLVVTSHLPGWGGCDFSARLIWPTVHSSRHTPCLPDRYNNKLVKRKVKVCFAGKGSISPRNWRNLSSDRRPPKNNKAIDSRTGCRRSGEGEEFPESTKRKTKNKTPQNSRTTVPVDWFGQTRSLAPV